jgi:hypothetical protein
VVEKYTGKWLQLGELISILEPGMVAECELKGRFFSDYITMNAFGDIVYFDMQEKKPSQSTVRLGGAILKAKWRVLIHPKYMLTLKDALKTLLDGNPVMLITSAGERKIFKYSKDADTLYWKLESEDIFSAESFYHLTLKDVFFGTWLSLGNLEEESK